MIEVKNISKSFDSKVILEPVSFRLENGKSYAIVGQSGVGKTTLLNIISGLERPSSGQVIIDNVEVNDKNLPYLRREKFGYIFQNFALIDDETVEDNLKVGLTNSDLSKKDKIILMEKVLKHLDIDVGLKQKVYSLSGGEQQRIALARILLKRPKIIFADEPTGSLDKLNEKIVLDSLLQDFDPTTTVLIATHSLHVLKRCDYVIKLENKKLKFEENINESDL